MVAATKGAPWLNAFSYQKNLSCRFGTVSITKALKQEPTSMMVLVVNSRDSEPGQGGRAQLLAMVSACKWPLKGPTTVVDRKLA